MTSPSPGTVSKLTDLVRQRDEWKKKLEHLYDVNSDGTPVHRVQDAEPQYDIMRDKVNDLNRALFTIYVKFLTPI
jgi:hypothetical protein